ncbi:hypothetical protein AB0K51_27955 [Kitasatospora sp. NPDC049285]|uniref:terpene synthase family protein n=1 Tax=Kitasatospora sp. NPDC049285 TaxID=3157096 RepID=UPI00341A2F80
MPQDIDYPFPPAPPRADELVDRLNARSLAWATAHGLLTGADARARYDAWDIAALSYYLFPSADEEGLQLYTDLLGYWFLLDDQFDGPLGADPARAAAVGEELIALLHLPAGAPVPDFPLARAFGELWPRLRHGMSPSWCGRMTHLWERFYASMAHEAVFRVERRPPTLDDFVELRRESGAMEMVVEMIDRIRGVELPASVRFSPLLQRLRGIAMDVPVWLNDVYTLEREEARGDTANLVLVIEHQLACDRVRALDTAGGMITGALEDYAELSDQIPELAGLLGGVAALDEYVSVHLRTIMDGYYHWERRTIRYQRAHELPADGPGYLEDLLASPVR